MALRVLLDQNVPRAACGFLPSRRPDWVTQHVADVDLWGATDESILQWAQADGSIVVTYDEDFADARMFPVGSNCGVIRLRVWPTSLTKVRQVPITGGQPRKLDLKIEQTRISPGRIVVHPDGHQIAYTGGERKGEVWVLQNFLPAVAK